MLTAQLKLNFRARQQLLIMEEQQQQQRRKRFDQSTHLTIIHLVKKYNAHRHSDIAKTKKWEMLAKELFGRRDFQKYMPTTATSLHRRFESLLATQKKRYTTIGSDGSIQMAQKPEKREGKLKESWYNLIEEIVYDSHQKQREYDEPDEGVDAECNESESLESLSDENDGLRKSSSKNQKQQHPRHEVASNDMKKDIHLQSNQGAYQLGLERDHDSLLVHTQLSILDKITSVRLAELHNESLQLKLQLYRVTLGLSKEASRQKELELRGIRLELELDEEPLDEAASAPHEDHF
jgi:hypothetical protein